MRTFLLLTMTVIMFSDSLPLSGLGQPSQTLPLVNVWSNACRSPNITAANVGCGTLTPGNTFQVEVNVTNAPIFNSYEFFLYYDNNYINAISFDLMTGTVFETGLPSNLVQHPLSTAGTVHLAVINNFNPPSYTGHNGTLAHITFSILKVGVSPLVLSAGITSAGGAGTELISNTTPVLVATSNGFFSAEPPKRVKFVDSPPASGPNSPGTWSSGEAVIYDADDSGTYSASDTVMNGTAPPPGTNLSVDYRVKFVDSPPASSPNSLGTWSSGDTIVYDADVSGTYSVGSVPDIIISGGTPALATNLSVDSDLGPIARFSYSPVLPKQGEFVTFNATDSFDPDGGLLRSYRWNLGTGGGAFTTQTAIYRVALSAGNFSIRLTVTDADDNFEGMQVQGLVVALANFHDLRLQGLSAPQTAPAGSIMAVRANILNAGSFSETYNLTVSYTPPSPSVIIGSKISQNITSTELQNLTFNWNTTGLSPGFYTIRGVISVALDNNTVNNVSSTTVQLLGPSPPPSNTPLLLGVAGVGIIAAVASTGVLLRRRRRDRDAD